METSTNESNPLFKTLEIEELNKLLREFEQLDIKPILLSAIDDYHINPDKYSFFCYYLRTDEVESAEKYLVKNNTDFSLVKSSYSLITFTFYVKYNNKSYGVSYNIELKSVSSIYRIN